MTQKTYKASSVISIRVEFPNGLRAQVSFEPLVDGSSQFRTTDTDLIYAMEHDQKYGKLFKLYETESVDSDFTYPKPSYSGTASPTGDFITFTSQTLTEQEKAQARENIGAATEPAELQNVLKYSQQSLTSSQKAQARTNIGVELHSVITNTEMANVLG